LDNLFLAIVVLLTGFVCGRVYESVAQTRARDRAAYQALSSEEKLIRRIEENMNVEEVRRLLDIARLDAARPSDGVTPIIAAMRWCPNNKNYQNHMRRYRVLTEIERRLPKDRFLGAINAQDIRGWTALMYAAEQSDALGGALLIHLGADPTRRNPEGRTAAEIAGRWPDAVDSFLGKSAPPSFPKILKGLEGPWR
jgi:hypothetical protein